MFSSCSQQTPQASLKTDLDSMSYAIGIANGAGFRQNLSTLPGDTCNMDDLIAGFVQALKNDTSAFKMSQEEAQMYIQTYFNNLQAKEAQKNKEEGEAFLAENKSKDGVQTTASGLQYQVLTEGAGEKPTAANKVKVHYKGTLIDGTQFDSSYDRGQPAEFGVGGVIPGWTEGLQLMPVGSKYMFWIPSELAYGEQGNYSIPGNSALIFEVELLEIVPEEEGK